jgi:hypothetical protein
MSFTTQGFDLDSIRSKEKENDRSYLLRMDPPRIKPCYSNVPGILPENASVIDTNLESQLQGLSHKLSRTSQVIEDPSPGASNYPLGYPTCVTDFAQISDGSRFSENNLLSDIQIQRFDRAPCDPSIIAVARRPSIGLDTRQFLKEAWKAKQGNMNVNQDRW